MTFKFPEVKFNTWHHAAVLSVFFALTRCAGLLVLPMFNDEAIYIRWATIVRENPSKLFVSAMDGKSPLFVWLNAMTLGFTEDILLSGRIVSVAAGAFAVAGIYLLGKKLFSPAVGFLASLIYLLLPFSTIHDRMALMDSLVTAFAVWLILLIVHFYFDQKRIYRMGLAMGAAMGLGFLTKTPFLMFFIFPVLGMFFFSDCKSAKLWKGLAVAYAVALMLMTPYLLYEPPSHTAGTDKVFHNAKILDSLIALLKFKNALLYSNIKELSEYLLAYVTWPLLPVFAVSLFRAAQARDRKAIFLAAWFVIVAGAIVFLGKGIFSRYFLFAIPPVALLSAKTLADWSNAVFERPGAVGGAGRFRPILSFGALCLLLSPAGGFDYKLIRSPESAGWAEKDRWQYTDSEYSGYGIREAADFFSAVAREKPVAVFVTETWGMPGDALYLYLRGRPNIRTFEAWWFTSLPVFPANIEKIKIFKSKYERGYTAVFNMNDLNDKEVYFVDRDHVSPPESLLSQNPNLKRIRSFKKLEKDFSFSVYRLDRSLKVYVDPSSISSGR